MTNPTRPRRTDPILQRRRGRSRRHGVSDHTDRIALEADGWRTTLDYRENHFRDIEGALEGVETHWRGEAERTAPDGRVQVLAVIGPTPGRVWRRLRLEAEVALDFRPCPSGAMR
ncbi:hypothetical protein [Ilumatobacter nonamiensis]|uniref:hypothetical protein n=1 Tax=Ilumatobacter nonamiensis TaxID=467093 RepID=UPI000344969C|nr:hypothetical protein [Ilumatobacter nonamiensis]